MLMEADFSVACSNRTKDNGQKLEHKKLYLNVTKNFFTVRVIEPWSKLLIDVVEPLSLEISKTHSCAPGQHAELTLL